MFGKNKQFKELGFVASLIDYLGNREVKGDLMVRSIQKWIKGREEHQNDLKKLDCKKEIEEEMIDVRAYEFIHEKIQGKPL